MLNSWSLGARAGYGGAQDFADLVNAEIVSCDCEIDARFTTADCGIEIDKARFGEITLYRYTSNGVHVARRGRGHISHDASDDILVYVPLTAAYAVRQGDVSLAAEPGLVALVRLDRPMSAAFVGRGRDPRVCANIRVPRLYLRDRVPQIERWIMRPVALGRGSGCILLRLLQASFDEAAHVDRESSHLVGDALADALGAVLRPSGDAEPGSAGKRRAAHAHALECIAVNLANPMLGPAFIARQCDMSLRSVHLAFEGSGWTANVWIREQRLQRCHADLADRAFGHLTVGDIAYRWGFKDPSHFSRAFRARFGRSPGSTRARES